MVDTSSFFSNKTLKTNYVCFRSLVCDNNKGKQYIIIEKEKIFYNRKDIEDFFNDLIEIGLNFKYKYVNNKEYQLYTHLLTQNEKIFLSMCIRIIYEGRYLMDITSKYGDTFYKIFEHYIKLKELLKNEKNKLVILCLANLCFSKGNSGTFNSNHSIIKKVIKIKTDLIGINNVVMVNAFFLDSKKEMTIDKKLKFPEDWTINSYNSLFKEFNYKNK